MQFAGDCPPIAVVEFLFVGGVVRFAGDIHPSAGVGVLSVGCGYQGCGLDR